MNKYLKTKRKSISVFWSIFWNDSKRTLANYWWRFRGWAWDRFTTVKPRYLKHTYCDSSALMPHVMFEILSNFLEEECFITEDGRPGEKCHVDWFWDEYHTQAWEEMAELYHWWHKVYMDKNRTNFWLDKSLTSKEKHELREEWDKTLTANLKRIIDVLPGMWT